MMEDLNISNEFVKVDRSKVRREKHHVMSTLRETHHYKGLVAIAFDCRKDDTKVSIAKLHGKKTFNLLKEEHVSVLEATGSLYIDHCSVENGKAITIGQELIDVINNSDPRESLRAVCSDGTNVNVGKDGGVIRYFELNVGRPLQRMICLFHFNELPFRHLFEFYFGKTTGPRTFGDEFGNKIIQDLTNCQLSIILQSQDLASKISQSKLYAN